MMTIQESLDNAARAKAVVDALEGNFMSGRVKDLKDVEGVSGDEERRAEEDKLDEQEMKVGEDNRENTITKAEEEEKEEIMAQLEQKIEEEEEWQKPADMAKEIKKK